MVIYHQIGDGRTYEILLCLYQKKSNLLHNFVLLHPSGHVADDRPLPDPLEDHAGLVVGEPLHHHTVHRQNLVTWIKNCFIKCVIAWSYLKQRKEK